MIRTKVTIGASVLAMVAVSAGVSYAAGAASENEVQACFNQSNALVPKGALRVVQDPADCKRWEGPILWAKSGTPGEPGPAGPQGPAGEPGPAGPAGGAPEVFFAATPFSISLTEIEIRKVVLSKSVPAGSYVIEANVTVQGSAGIDTGRSYVECLLPDDAAQGATIAAPAQDGGRMRLPGTERIEITSAINHPGGEIELKCVPEVNDTTVVISATLLVTKVASVD